MSLFLPRCGLRGRRASAGLAAWLVLVIGSAATAQDAGVTELSPAGTVADWTMDESSGRVFAALSDGGKVVEMDPATGKLVREFPLADKPRQLLVKAGKLVATAEAGCSVFVIDLKTNQVEGRLQLSGSGPNALFCSRADNPYVYAACKIGDGSGFGGGNTLFQIDLSTRKVRKGDVQVAWNHGYVSNVSMSADGKSAVVDGRRAGVSPSGAALIKFDESDASGVETFRHHNSFPPIIADPYSRGWAFGGELYPADIRASVRKFRGYAVGFHPSADLVAGFGGDQRFSAWDENAARSVTLQTYSSAEVLKEVQLTQRPANAARRPAVNRDRQTFVDDPVLQFDVKNDRLLVAWRDTAHVVSLKAAGVTAKPLVMIDAPSAVSLDLGGAPLKLPLALRDPKLSPGTKFVLDGGPAGATLTGTTLAWTPGTADVGEHVIKVRAERDGSSDTLSLKVAVRRPSVELGGSIRDVVVDAAGARALAHVMLPPDPKKPRRPDVYGNQQGGSELVLVDLKTMKVVARRSFDEPIQAIGLTAAGAFFAPANVARIHRLKLADLADDGRTFTNGNVMRIELLPFGDLAVFSQAGANRFDGSRLTPAPWIGGANQQYYDPYGQQAGTVARVNGASVVGPMVIDAATNSIRMLQSAPNLPTIASDPQHQNAMMNRGQGGPLGLWGRRVVGSQLMGPDNTVVTQIGQGVSFLLESYPAVATVSTTMEGTNQRTRVSRIDFRDLVEGNRTPPLNLSATPIDPNRYYGGGEQTPSRLIERAGRLFVGLEDRLYVIDPPADLLGKLPKPLYFTQKMEPLQAPVKAAVTVKTELVGGKGAKTFELPGSPQGTSIDPATGTITVDTVAVWKKHLETLAAPNPYGYAYGYGGPTTRPGEGPAEAAQAAYRGLMGRDCPADAYPLALHLRAVAKDEENQKAELSGYVVLLGSKKDVVDALAKRDAAQRSAVAAARAQEARMYGGGPTTMPAAARMGGGGDVAALQQRVAELERQNERLQAQNDMLKEMIRSGAGGARPASRPSF
ncbi:MAG TPA: hypothetical protein VF796_25925 [Humisphaera sp.]